MADGRAVAVQRSGRRWSFANCVFDEANWALVVDGRRVLVETKPLEILRHLLAHAGTTVSKGQLLDSIWPDVSVVEASLPTAVRKLRCALNDDERDVHIIETIPRIGYRLAVPVTEESSAAEPALATTAASLSEQSYQLPANTRVIALGTALALLLATLAILTVPSERSAASRTQPTFSDFEIETAVRKLDVEKVEAMLAAGWDPSTPWDGEGNDALTMVLNHCEWDLAHDRRKMLLMARALIEGGVNIERRNVFGDTPYSIAKAPRYCGPDHPVTQMLEAMCYGGDVGPKDRCLATYELTADQRKAQGLPPKG